MVASIEAVMAASDNGIIGYDNELPWRMRSDLKHFKRLTIDGVVVMGSNTFKSMGSMPLPKRTNVILTRNPDLFDPTQVLAFSSVDQILHEFSHLDRLFIIGGAGVYKSFQAHINVLHLSRIHCTVATDVHHVDGLVQAPDFMTEANGLITEVHEYQREEGDDFDWTYYRVEL